MRLTRSGKRRAHGVGMLGLALAVITAACGSGGGTSTAAKAPAAATTTTTVNKNAGTTITIGSFNFGESEILMNMYAGVLKKAGFNVALKDKLGNREVVEPALESGQIDLIAEYESTSLEFLNKGAGQASGDVDATYQKLKALYAAKNITVLTPSPAADQNAFAVTKDTATKFSLKKMSDLAPVAAQMTLGGPPECPTRPYCQKGLQTTYGLNFKDFKALDSDGPLTKSALDSGAIQVGLLFSSDGSITAKGYVVLDDDKHLQNADNIVPVIRNDKANADAQAALNKVSAALTSDKLAALNKQVDIDKADPADVAKKFLSDNGLA